MMRSTGAPVMPATIKLVVASTFYKSAQFCRTSHFKVCEFDAGLSLVTFHAGTLNFAASFVLCNFIPFVVLCLAASQRDLHLDSAILEVDSRRDQRQTLLLRFALQKID